MGTADSRVRQPTVSQLRAFLAVAERLHFRDAASAVGVSQPALSGGIAALEEVLGVTLLERTTRRVLLTPAGERLAVRARAVLDAVGELSEEAEAARAPFTGPLRLGVIPTCAPYLLPTVLRLVRDDYPALDLTVHEEQTEQLVTGVQHGRLDLLLLAVPLGTPQLTELPLFDEDFCLVTPADHELAGQRGIPRESLTGQGLILLNEGHCLRDQALDICRDAGQNPGTSVAASAAGLSTLVQLVAGGMGVTLLPSTALQVETARNENLATSSFAAPAPTRRIALVMRAGTAREGEFRALAGSLRMALRPLPVRLLSDDGEAVEEPPAAGTEPPQPRSVRAARGAGDGRGRAARRHPRRGE